MCDDDELKFEACTRWGKKEFVFTVNLAYHNIHDWAANKALIIHEFAHFREQSNAHLLAGFWRASEIIGSKLTLLAESNPGLFRGKVAHSSPSATSGSSTLRCWMMPRRRPRGPRRNSHRH